MKTALFMLSSLFLVTCLSHPIFCLTFRVTTADILILILFGSSLLKCLFHAIFSRHKRVFDIALEIVFLYVFLSAIVIVWSVINTVSVRITKVGTQRELQLHLDARSVKHAQAFDVACLRNRWQKLRQFSGPNWVIRWTCDKTVILLPYGVCGDVGLYNKTDNVVRISPATKAMRICEM